MEVPVVAAVSPPARVRGFPFWDDGAGYELSLLSPAHIPLHLAGVGPMGVLAALVWPESSARAVSLLGLHHCTFYLNRSDVDLTVIPHAMLCCTRLALRIRILLLLQSQIN